MHFAKQRISATGPRLPNRQAMFNKLLQSEAIRRAIEDEAKSKISVLKKHKKKHIKFWMKLQLMSAIQVYVQ